MYRTGRKNFMKKMELSYNEAMKYRSAWMGVAILWVILFHANFSIPHTGKLALYGYGGVDVFFFASGIGCRHSLNRNKDFLAFFKKRLKRIMPTYLIFLAGWTVYKILSGGMTFQEILGNLFCCGYICGMDNQFNWYMDALWIFYLIAPWLFLYAEKNAESNKKLGFMFVFLTIFSMVFINNSVWIIIVTRLPVFFMGMVFDIRGEQGKTITCRGFLVLLVCMILGFVLLSLFYRYAPQYLWVYGLDWYPFILITPGLCCLISVVLKYLKGLGTILSKAGEISFEIYLLHIPFLDVFQKYYGGFYYEHGFVSCLITLGIVGAAAGLLHLSVRRFMGGRT